MRTFNGNFGRKIDSSAKNFKNSSKDLPDMTRRTERVMDGWREMEIVRSLQTITITTAQ